MGEDTYFGSDYYDGVYVGGTPSNIGLYGGGGGGGSPSFWNALTQGLTSTSGILGARYAVPQLNNGQVLQYGANGQLMYAAQGANGMPSLNLGGSSSTLLLFGGAALVMIMMLKK